MRNNVRTLLMIFIGAWVLPIATSCSKTSEPIPATKAERTTISPYLEAQIDSKNNTLYCASFQIAWDKMRKQIVKEDILLQGNPLTAQRLNQPLLTAADISGDSFVADAGALSQELVDRINREVLKKFNGQMQETFTIPQGASGQKRIIAYASLYKNLEFITEFEKLASPVSFAANDSSTPVKAFGIETFSPDKHKDLSDQIRIFDYRSDNDFILSLTSKSENDEIIIAKVMHGNNLLDTYQAVIKRIVNNKRSEIYENETLKIPKIDFNLTHNFSELEGKWLLNNGWDGWLIDSAKQETRFKLDEKGAMLRSVGFMIFQKKEDAPAPGFRKFIFDKPFLICLKQKTGKYPYFALWINNPELMIRQ